MKIEKICTGCGRSSLNLISEQYAACCPDNNYIEMSNNKQSMKLYTEEQVRLAMDFARGHNKMTDSQFIDLLIPIELPSDEEIKEISRDKSRLIYDEETNFQLGAKYVIDKIQGGNNE